MFGDCLPSPLIHARGILLNVWGTHHVVGYFDTHFGVDMLPEFYRRGFGPRGHEYTTSTGDTIYINSYQDGADNLIKLLSSRESGI
jgi:hypothetical protein